MKLQTALEKLEFFAYHGIYPEEKINGGNFIIDIWIDEEFDDSKEFKQLEHLINYEEIFKLIQEEMNVRRDFIEDLGKTILERVLLHLSDRDVIITLKITKPNPGGRFGSGAASITLQG